jgi:nucleoside 2-deoxyribosyltransferase
MARFFMSYAYSDRDLVERLEHALVSQGHTVFIDRGEVPEGSSWAETIRDAIEKADAFVVLVSKDSLRHDMAVSAEVGAAWARGKRIVAIETSDVDAATALPLPRSHYSLVHANGLSDSQLADTILKYVKAEAINPAS